MPATGACLCRGLHAAAAVATLLSTYCIFYICGFIQLTGVTIICHLETEAAASNASKIAGKPGVRCGRRTPASTLLNSTLPCLRVQNRARGKLRSTEHRLGAKPCVVAITPIMAGKLVYFSAYPCQVGPGSRKGNASWTGTCNPISKAPRRSPHGSRHKRWASCCKRRET